MGVALALFTAWPLAHRALVAAFDVDPWKLGGWAMYVEPRFVPRVEVVPLGRTGEPGEPAGESFAFSREDATRVDAFAARRLTLGRLAAPDGLARDLLAAHPHLPGLLVRVRTRRLDLETARLEERVDRYAYRRGRDGAPVRVESAR